LMNNKIDRYRNDSNSDKIDIASKANV
jgi:hypothetical protein